MSEPSKFWPRLRRINALVGVVVIVEWAVLGMSAPIAIGLLTAVFAVFLLPGERYLALRRSEKLKQLPEPTDP